LYSISRCCAYRADLERIEGMKRASRAERLLKVKLNKIRNQKQASDNALRVERARRRALEKKLTDNASQSSTERRSDGDSADSLSSDESLPPVPFKSPEKKKVTFVDNDTGECDGYDSDGWSEEEVYEEEEVFGTVDEVLPKKIPEDARYTKIGKYFGVPPTAVKNAENLSKEDFDRMFSAAMRRPSEARPTEKIDLKNMERYLDGNEGERFEIKMKTDLALLRIQHILDKPDSTDY